MKKGREISLGKFNFNFSNRVLYSLITLFVIAIVGVGVYAVTAPTPVGHGSEQVNVDIGGTVKTLQDAIDAGELGGSGGGGGWTTTGTTAILGSYARGYVWTPTSGEKRVIFGSPDLDTYVALNIGGTNHLVVQDGTGNVGIGTTEPIEKLSIIGGLLLMRQEGNIPSGAGPSLILQSPSLSAGVQKGSETACGEVSPLPVCGIDDANGNIDTVSTDNEACPSGSSGLIKNDVYKTGTQYYKKAITCVTNTESYSLRVNSGVLEFLNSAGDIKYIIPQAGFMTREVSYMEGVNDFLVPAGVYQIKAIVVGGGGGGGSGGNGAVCSHYGGTGGSGGGIVEGFMNVIPGETLSIFIGEGGSGTAQDVLGVAGASGQMSYINLPPRSLTGASLRGIRGNLYASGGGGGGGGSSAKGMIGTPGENAGGGGYGNNGGGKGDSGQPSIYTAGSPGDVAPNDPGTNVCIGDGGTGGGSYGAGAGNVYNSRGNSAAANSGGGGAGGSNGARGGGNGGSGFVKIYY